MTKCKFCGKLGKHYCNKVERVVTEESDSDFFTDAATIVLGMALIDEIFDTPSIDSTPDFGGGGGDFGGGGSSGEW